MPAAASSDIGRPGVMRPFTRLPRPTWPSSAISALNPVTVRYSPDSSRSILTVKKGKKWVALIDGVESQKYDEILLPLFSQNSKRYIFIAKKGNKWLTVTDGKEGTGYDAVTIPIISKDSQHIIYMAKKGKQWFIVKDNEVMKGYDGVALPAFSHDSSHYAYAASRNNTWFVVVDGVEGKEMCSGILKDATLIFDKDKSLHTIVLQMRKADKDEYVINVSRLDIKIQ